MTLGVNLLARLTATQSGGNDFGGPAFKPEMAFSLALADGTGAVEADILFMDERTVATGANDDIDLAGALSDAFGATITAAEVVALFVINRAKDGTANTTDLTIGNASSAFEGFLSASGTIGPIKPGGVLFLAAGDAAGLGAVTGGSTDELRIANSAGASATYQIGIVARSA